MKINEILNIGLRKFKKIKKLVRYNYGQAQ